MFHIAINTFKEIIRNKFLYVILLFAFCFILLTLTLGTLSLWNENRVIVDFGLAMIEIFWVLWVLFIGSQLLFNEIQWKTIFLILSKPIQRYEFLLWKFIWFSYILAIIIALQSLLFLIILLLKGIEIDLLILFSLLYAFLKLEILLSIVLFFSTFMSNILTILVSIIVYFMSHSLSLVLDMVRKTGNAIALYVTNAFTTIFPPLESINIKNFIGSFQDYSLTFLLSNALYSVIYISVILFLSVIIFNRKKFEW